MKPVTRKNFPRHLLTRQLAAVFSVEFGSEFWALTGAIVRELPLAHGSASGSIWASPASCRSVVDSFRRVLATVTHRPLRSYTHTALTTAGALARAGLSPGELSALAAPVILSVTEPGHRAWRPIVTAPALFWPRVVSEPLKHVGPLGSVTTLRFHYAEPGALLNTALLSTAVVVAAPADARQHSNWLEGVF